MRSHDSVSKKPGRRDVIDRAALERHQHPGGPETASIARLQGALGNRAVCALLGAQAKLDVGRSDDPLEREADAVASQVVQALRSPADSGSGPDLAGVAPGGQIARTIQRRTRATLSPSGPMGPEGGTVPGDVERSLLGARSGGRPLPAAVRRSMEGAFGANFDGVRVHTGPTAGALGERLGAKAFTVGNDIFFRSGLPDNATPEGQHLLAHELAHTVQQGGSAPSTAARVMRDTEQETTEQESTEEAGGRALATETEQESTEEEGEGGVVIASGTLPPLEKELISTAPPSGMVADRVVGTGRSTGRRPKAASARHPGTHPLSVGTIDVVDSERRSSAVLAQAQEDKISPSITVTSNTTSGRTVTPFGAMGPDLVLENQVYAVKAKKAKKVKEGETAPLPDATVKVSFTLKFDCSWGTTDGGRTDVPSADAAVVTADTYQQIVTDLTPHLIEKSWRAPRDTYWSEAICARHEKYHASDARSWAKSQGKKLLVNYLKKQTVTLTATQRDDLEQVKTEMQDILVDAQNAFIQAYGLYMNGSGLTYLSYPSEERAFGDGKKPYINLAKAVEKKGKALAKAKAKATAPTTTGTGGG